MDQIIAILSAIGQFFDTLWQGMQSAFSAIAYVGNYSFFMSNVFNALPAVFAGLMSVFLIFAIIKAIISIF